ncbi:hypothetical protein GWK47_037389 [Chionoecetes opilio]|uniref:Uncharacterized protein n=1 Tax=Chionoecetes opilio TaxID=41210 RepID=A0A8J4YLT7_CHIOP|nr:hypothetical protein GWK47_037389 [Chionoecetes opilio]
MAERGRKPRPGGEGLGSLLQRYHRRRHRFTLITPALRTSTSIRRGSDIVRPPPRMETQTQQDNSFSSKILDRSFPARKWLPFSVSRRLMVAESYSGHTSIHRPEQGRQDVLLASIQGARRQSASDSQLQHPTYGDLLETLLQECSKSARLIPHGRSLVPGESILFAIVVHASHLTVNQLAVWRLFQDLFGSYPFTRG